MMSKLTFHYQSNLHVWTASHAIYQYYKKTSMIYQQTLKTTPWLPFSYELSTTSNPSTNPHKYSSSPFRYMWQYRWNTTKFFLLSYSALVYCSAIIWATPFPLALLSILSPWDLASSFFAVDVDGDACKYLGWALNGTNKSVPWNFRLLSTSCSNAQAWTLINPPFFTIRCNSERHLIRRPSVLRWCITAMHMAASQLSLRSGRWMQSATATAGCVLSDCFSLGSLWYCGPSVLFLRSTPSSISAVAAVFRSGSLELVTYYNNAC